MSPVGGMAEFMVVPVSNAAIKPPGVGVIAAAACPTSVVTAHTAVKTIARVQRGERVLVLGGSGDSSWWSVTTPARWPRLGCSWRRLWTTFCPWLPAYQQPVCISDSKGIADVLKMVDSGLLSVALDPRCPFPFTEAGVKECLSVQMCALNNYSFGAFALASPSKSAGERQSPWQTCCASRGRSKEGQMSPNPGSLRELRWLDNNAAEAHAD